jgi:hypothetical protein
MSDPSETEKPSLVRFEMVVTPEFLEVVDDWRKRQQEVLNRSEAIRRLVLLGAQTCEAVATAEFPKQVFAVPRPGRRKSVS